MRSLGLQNSLTCEGVLQSARSIEAAFVRPMPSIPGIPASSATAAAAAVDAARQAAVSRSRKLLNFVDHRADQLLLASGESGRWFVDPRTSPVTGGASNGGSGGNGTGGGGAGGAGGARGAEGDEEQRRECMSSSGSESGYEDECSEDDEEGDEEGRVQGREAKIAVAMERRERRRERKERDNARAAAVAAALRLPPPNEFVEELASIAWLPVHGRAPNDLLPWKVCWLCNR